MRATIAMGLGLVTALAGACKDDDDRNGTDDTPAATDDAAAEEPADAAAAIDDAEALLEVWNDWSGAMAARDTDALAGLYADDAVYVPAGAPEQYRQTGGEAIAGHYQQFFSGFPDLETDPLLVLVDVDDLRIGAIARARGTNTEAMMGQPATGETTSFLGFTVIEVGPEGDIVRETAHADNLNFMAHLGYWNGEHRPVDEGDAPEVSVVSEGEAPAEAFAQTFVDAFNARDAKALAGLYTDDAVLHRAPAARDAEGAEAIRAAYERLFEAYSDLEMSEVDAWGVGDHVVVTYELSGTNDGRLERFQKKATGESFTTPGADVHRLAGDGATKIEKTWSFVDGMAIAAQLGAVAFPPPQ